MTVPIIRVKVVNITATHIALSSNGRTLHFECRNRGSNPRGAVKNTFVFAKACQQFLGILGQESQQQVTAPTIGGTTVNNMGVTGIDMI